MKTSLLPLNAIVCPQGRIPLQIFEPYYLDMVSDCLKNNKEFIVVLMHEGCSESEVGSPLDSSAFYKQGTKVKIVDFGTSSQNGVISITVEGVSRVQLFDVERQSDGLWLAKSEDVSFEEYAPLPSKFDELRVVLEALVKHPFVKELNMDIDYHDSSQVGWRLTELLPLGNREKQCLYEMTDSVSRLEKISKQINEMIT